MTNVACSVREAESWYKSFIRYLHHWLSFLLRMLYFMLSSSEFAQLRSFLWGAGMIFISITQHYLQLRFKTEDHR